MRLVCGMMITGVLSLLVLGCSAATSFTHYFKSTDHFRPLDREQRVLYEPGAEPFAEVVDDELLG